MSTTGVESARLDLGPAREGAFAPLGAWYNTVSHHGERYLPLASMYSAAMHLGHMASYREALRYSYGRRVLDIGCGTGYGAFFLASYGAAEVVGVDLSAESLAYAQAIYSHPRVHYLQADATHLPFEDGRFDFIFSSQVIEHVPSSKDFLLEVRRLLAPGGFCLITTPNLELFSPGGAVANPHHLSEMDWQTYRAIAGEVFPRTWFRGIPQNCISFSAEHGGPVGKPNGAIRIEDYMVREQGLEECENMLCYGHTDLEGTLEASLPHTLQPVADELAPFFWEPLSRRWLVLGSYPPEVEGEAIVLEAGQQREESFRAPYSHLCRVELDSRSSVRGVARVRIGHAGQPGHVLTSQLLTAWDGPLAITFAPQADSAGQLYRLTIEPARDEAAGISAPVPLRLRVVDAAGAGAGQLALRTFHSYLPPPV